MGKDAEVDLWDRWTDKGGGDPHLDIGHSLLAVGY